MSRGKGKWQGGHVFRPAEPTAVSDPPIQRRSPINRGIVGKY